MGEKDSKTSGRRYASFPSPNYLSPTIVKWGERRAQRKQLWTARYTEGGSRTWTGDGRKMKGMGMEMGLELRQD